MFIAGIEDQANGGQKLGSVWRNRKKISQIINDIYLPFFLLFILWSQVRMRVTSMAYSLGFKEDEEDMKRYMKKRTLGKLPKETLSREKFLLNFDQMQDSSPQI